MADQASVLDIVIKMRSEGRSDIEITERLKKMGLAVKDVTKAMGEQTEATNKLSAAQEKQRAKAGAAAMADVHASNEKKRQAKVLEELKRAQQDASDEEEKATAKTNEAAQAVKGFALENSQLAQALRLLQSPFALLGAAAGFAIAWLKNYVNAADEAAKASEDFARASGPINQVTLALRAMKGEDAALDQFFKDQAAAANSVEAAYREMNEQLALTAQLTAKVDQAKLQETIAGIEANENLSPAQKIQQKFGATEAAKAKKLADDEADRVKAQENRHAELNKAAFAAEQNRRAALGLEPGIAAQSATASSAEKSLTDTTAEAAARSAFIKKVGPLMREFAEGNVDRTDAIAAGKNLAHIMEGEGLGIHIPGRDEMIKDPSRAAAAIEAMRDREQLDNIAVSRAAELNQAEKDKLGALQGQRQRHIDKAKANDDFANKTWRDWQRAPGIDAQTNAADEEVRRRESNAGAMDARRAALATLMPDARDALKGFMQFGGTQNPGAFVNVPTALRGAGGAEAAAAAARQMEAEMPNAFASIERALANMTRYLKQVQVRVDSGAASAAFPSAISDVESRERTRRSY